MFTSLFSSSLFLFHHHPATTSQPKAVEKAQPAVRKYSPITLRLDENNFPSDIITKLTNILEDCQITHKNEDGKHTWKLYPRQFVTLLRDDSIQIIEEKSTQTEDVAAIHVSSIETQTEPSCYRPVPSRSIPEWIEKSMQNNPISISNKNEKRKNPDDPIQTNKRIRLDPDKQFNLVFNQKAIKNISHVDIPDEILLALSLGPKFVPPTDDNDKMKIVSDITKLKNTQFSTGVAIPNHTINQTLAIVKGHKCVAPSWKQKQTAKLISLAEAFLKDHKDLHIDISDKGNVTIIMLKADYIDKILQKLNDQTTYAKLNTSSHAAYVKMNHNLLQRLATAKFIYPTQITDILANETQHSMIYGLIKIHKPDYPVRLINANIKTVGNKISEILLKSLNKMTASDPFRVTNSQQLTEKLNKLELAPTDKLFTLDIVDMFTNIPVDAALNIIKERDISQYTKIPLELYTDLYKFCTKTAREFCFNDCYYKQIRGLPMGAATSPALACLVTNEVLTNAIQTCDPIKLIVKYVDDLLLITSDENAKKLITALNQHPTLNFVISNEDKNNSVEYLDMTIIRKSDHVITKWCPKTYASHRLLNWHSDHDRHMIIQTAVNYVSNMFALSEKIFFDEIQIQATDILILNSFPKHITNSIINDAKRGIHSSTQNPSKYIGTSADTSLIRKMNSLLENTTGNLVKFVRKTNDAKVQHILYSSRKSKEDFKFRNNLVVKFTCIECAYELIQPITKPLFLYSTLNLSYTDHPHNDINTHCRTERHNQGFDTKILYTCDNSDETLRMAEIAATMNKIPVAKKAKGANAVPLDIIRKNHNVA